MYKQVRHMTGALLSVGQGKLQLSFLQNLLDIGNSQPPGMWVCGVGAKKLAAYVDGCVHACRHACSCACVRERVC
jgi:hypothetical protein